MKKKAEMKFCPKCRKTKPLTAEHFYRNGPWLSAPCKECKRALVHRHHHGIAS